MIFLANRDGGLHTYSQAAGVLTHIDSDILSPTTMGVRGYI